MNLIVAADKNWGIGRNNELLVSIPADMKFFRQMTTGKTVVMGRRTLESFPGGRPLKNRTNIVLTKEESYRVEGALVVHNLAELAEVLKDYNSKDVYVIGGGSVYRQLLPYCSLAHVTKIDHIFDADVYFPDLDGQPDWVIAGDSEEQTYFDLEYRFLLYQNLKPRELSVAISG